MLYFCPIGQKTLNVNNAKWAPTSKFLKFSTNYGKKGVNFFLKPVVKNNMGHIKEPYFE